MAEECKAGDPPPPWSGLSHEVKEALDQCGWEPVAGVEFPLDPSAAGGIEASTARIAVVESGHVMPMQGVLDVG